MTNRSAKLHNHFVAPQIVALTPYRRQCPRCYAPVGQACKMSPEETGVTHVSRWLKVMKAPALLIKLFKEHDYRACPLCTTHEGLMGSGTSRDIATHMLRIHSGEFNAELVGS